MKEKKVPILSLEKGETKRLERSYLSTELCSQHKTGLKRNPEFFFGGGKRSFSTVGSELRDPCNKIIFLHIGLESKGNSFICGIPIVRFMILL